MPRVWVGGAEVYSPSLCRRLTAYCARGFQSCHDSKIIDEVIACKDQDHKQPTNIDLCAIRSKARDLTRHRNTPHSRLRGYVKGAYWSWTPPRRWKLLHVGKERCAGGTTCQPKHWWDLAIGRCLQQVLRFSREEICGPRVDLASEIVKLRMTDKEGEGIRRNCRA